MERLVKLVPAEAVAVYPLLFSEANGLADPVNRAHAVALVSWIILAIVIVLRCQATAATDRGPQLFAVAISAISYIIWVYVWWPIRRRGVAAPVATAIERDDRVAGS
jgi:predicted neutral ceramidase superfamily lipid hydrolase